MAHFLERLASFARVITFDKRGTGLSDRELDTPCPTLEDRTDDIRAVMDAVDSKKAALFGFSEGASMAVLFAATYPERCHNLILFGPMDTSAAWCPTEEKFQTVIQYMDNAWGSGGITPFVAPRGAAQISRHDVSTPVFAGMIAASAVGIFVIPLLYVTFQMWRERSGARI